MKKLTILIILISITLIIILTTTIQTYEKEIRTLTKINTNITHQLQIVTHQKSVHQNNATLCQNDLTKWENYFVNVTNEYKNTITKQENSLYKVRTQNFDLEKENRNLKTFQGVSKFKTVMVDVAEAHKYVMNEYDCTEFSQELAHQLRKTGWEANKIRVIVDCNSGLFLKETCTPFEGRHAIVKVENVYLEATTGNIINPTNYEEYGIKN